MTRYITFLSVEHVCVQTKREWKCFKLSIRANVFWCKAVLENRFYQCAQFFDDSWIGNCCRMCIKSIKIPLEHISRKILNKVPLDVLRPDLDKLDLCAMFFLIFIDTASGISGIAMRQKKKPTLLRWKTRSKANVSLDRVESINFISRDENTMRTKVRLLGLCRWDH